MLQDVYRKESLFLSFYKEKSTGEHSREIEYVSQDTVKKFILNKIVPYTWRLNDILEFPGTAVTWELEEIDVNKTKVALTHSGFTGKEEGKLSITKHDKGCSYFSGRLEKYCKEKR